MSTTTLADRVYAVLSDDNRIEPSHHLALAAPVVRNDDGTVQDELHLDLCEWGFAFGVAFAIARGEDAYESRSTVTARAEQAAREAWARWAEDSDLLTGATR